MKPLTLRALEFAEIAHADQKRKYTGEPYVMHCLEVGQIVLWVDGTPEMVAAAYLHDTVEDCGVTLDQIRAEFGEQVATLVEMLTDISKPSDGNRDARKALDRDHTAKASPEAKTIKLADLISNTKSIVQHDKNFAKVYLKEKERLLEVLTEGHPDLYSWASELLVQSKLQLMEEK